LEIADFPSNKEGQLVHFVEKKKPLTTKTENINKLVARYRK
jgi:hypothetical protein